MTEERIGKCLRQVEHIRKTFEVMASTHKRDDFNFPIVNFPFICSNIPAAPAYEVYIF
jgi:hypothetical protein